MGRLKEHVEACGLESLPQVAKRLAAQVEGGPKWESLANNLRKLDAGKDIDWWQGKGSPFWEPLWRLLGLEDEGELLQLVLPMSAEAAGNRWFFRQFTELRPLDLTKEPLFPGIPEHLVVRGGPRGDRTWWVAPPGFEKALLGSWLEARYGWTVLRCATWTEAQEKLPSYGRTYLELGTSPGPVPALSMDLRLCVASSSAAPTDGWDVVETAPATAWWLDLVRWANERLSKPGGLARLADPEALRDLVTSPGEGISLLGAIDSVGTKSKQAHARWAQHWLSAAVAPIPDPFPVRSHLTKHGFEMLVVALQGLLRRGQTSCTSRETWCDVLSVHEDVEPDLDVLLSLALQRSSRKQDFIDAIRPSAEAILDGFVRIGLIRDVEGQYSAEHAWVTKLARRDAVEKLVSTEEGFGALLMNRASVEAAMERLKESIEGGTRDGVTSELRPVPEELAFRDGFVRAVGVLACTAWRETSPVTLPRELVEQAWALGRELSVQRWENRPTFPVFGLPCGPTGSWAADATWFVACLGLSLWLWETGHPLPEPGPLNPWSGTAEASDIEQLLEGLVEAELPRGAEPAPHAVRVAALSIGDRLVEHLGPLQHRNQLAPAQLPTLAVLRAGESGGSIAVEGMQLNYAVTSVRTICRWRGLDLAAVYRAWWPLWLERKNGPPFVRTTGHGGLPAAELAGIWNALPPGSMNSLLYKGILRRPELWPEFGEAVWEAWLLQWSLETRIAEEDEPAIFQAMPAELACRLLRSAPHPRLPKVRGVLWRRFPKESLDAVDELAQREPVLCEVFSSWHQGVLHDLCETAPDVILPELIDRALHWVNDPDSFPGARPWVRRWLHQVVNDRAPGWSAAAEVILAEALPPRDGG